MQLPTRHSTSTPRTSASTTSRPEAPMVSAMASRPGVTGGASRSAFVSFAMRAVSPSVRVAENDTHLVFAGEAEGNGSAGGVVVGDDRGETFSGLEHERRVERDDRRMLPVGAFVDGLA